MTFSVTANVGCSVEQPFMKLTLPIGWH